MVHKKTIKIALIIIVANIIPLLVVALACSYGCSHQWAYAYAAGWGINAFLLFFGWALAYLGTNHQ